LSANIVSGKSYETFPNSEGLRLFEQAQAVFSGTFPHFNDKSKLPLDERFGKPQFISPRLGQGWFGIMVINEYDRKCAITGEKNLPVLETAHIKPYSENGPHKVCNGIFMRYGLHALFDGGYMTLSNEFHVEVSRRIREEFSNGREYSAPHGEKLLTLPEKEAHRPSLEHLEWYQSNCYLGWK
jgi:putative restriction endonuclease